MIAAVPNQKNPWRLLCMTLGSLFKLIVIAIGFVTKYHITTRTRTNANSKWDFLMRYAIYKAPARKIGKEA